MDKTSTATPLMLQTRLKAIVAFVVFLTILPLSTVLATTWTSVQHGPWNQPATWGLTRIQDCPGSNVTHGDNVIIKHNVTIGDVKITNGGNIVITPGSLTGGELALNNGALITVGSGASVEFTTLDLKQGGSIAAAPGASMDFATPNIDYTHTGTSETFTEITIDKIIIKPLPVSWLFFKGNASEKGNDLNWATASEKNSLAFEVERSLNGKTFEKIGTVKAAGNSNQVLTYQFSDKQPVAGVTSYYRLKQTDMDGKFEYSSIVAVAKNNRLAELVTVSPNPFSESLKLQLAPNQTVEKVVLLDLNGKVVYSKNMTTTSEVVLSDLPVLKSGIYLLQLISDKEVISQKVVRQ